MFDIHCKELYNANKKCFKIYGDAILPGFDHEENMTIIPY